MKYTIGQIADHFGVNVVTVRRWEKAGRIRCERTPGGHRSVCSRFNLEHTNGVG